MNKKDLLNLIDITVSFEGFLALNKLNLNLKKGELRAVLFIIPLLIINF